MNKFANIEILNHKLFSYTSNGNGKKRQDIIYVKIFRHPISKLITMGVKFYRNEAVLFQIEMKYNKVSVSFHYY